MSTHARACARLAIVALCFIATACATKVAPPSAPPVAPPVVEAPAKPAAAPPVRPKPAPAQEAVEPPKEAAKEPSRSLGLDELAKGIRSYEDGDYQASALQLAAALDLGLALASDRASAHKHLAFIACSAQRIAACRSEFRRAFAADPAFDLSRAEAGHPTWGPVFRSVKAEVAKAKSKPKPKAKPKAAT